MTSSDTQECWYVSNRLWIFLILAAALIAYPFFDYIQHMVGVWNRKEEYGYAYMLPFITIFLIWQRKAILANTEFKPTYIAVPLLFVSGLIHFMGAASAMHTLSQYALVLTILALAYGVLGWRSFKVVAIPIALLFLMIPLPLFIFNDLSGKLQLISSEIGVAFIRAFGISVYLEGNVIDLGTYKLQVVEACSGLRYLFPLISLSFVAAYLYNVETWKRVVVFLSSIPITVIMNSFRIGVIGVLVEYFGIEQAEGFLHDFEGWIIFMACMGVLFIEMAVLARVGKKKYKLIDVFGIEIPDPVGEDCDKKEQKIHKVHYALLATLFLYSVSILFVQHREDLTLTREDFNSFPLVINEWSGKKQTLEKDVLDSLKTDDYIMSDYLNDKGKTVNFYVAYYASQRSGASAHSPRGCIPGGGWQIDEFSRVDLSGVEIMGESLSVNRLIIKKGEYGQLVYYWFQQRDRVVTSEYLVKWYLFWDSLTRNRTDGSLIRLTTVISPGEDLEKADARLVSFVKELEPLLGKYLPE